MTVALTTCNQPEARDSTCARPSACYRAVIWAREMVGEAGILTVDDVAAFLQVTPAQVRELLDAGELAGFKVAGAWRVPTSAVTDYLRRGMEVAKLQALSRGLTDPRAWARALADMPELRATLEAQHFAESTMGAFLKDALRQVELESKADNVVQFKPKPE